MERKERASKDMILETSFKTLKSLKTKAREIPEQKFTEYARLNAPRSQILMDIERYKDFHWARPIKSDLEKRNQNMYYRYHNDVVHNKNEFRKLNDEIQILIRIRKLSKYSKDEDNGNGNRDNRENRHNRDTRYDRDKRPQPRWHVVNIISGGPTMDVTSRNSRKAFV